MIDICYTLVEHNMLFTGVKYFTLANQSATAMLNNLAAILFINIIIIIKPINLIRQFETR